MKCLERVTHSHTTIGEREWPQYRAEYHFVRVFKNVAIALTFILTVKVHESEKKVKGV